MSTARFKTYTHEQLVPLCEAIIAYTNEIIPLNHFNTEASRIAVNNLREAIHGKSRKDSAPLIKTARIGVCGEHGILAMDYLCNPKLNPLKGLRFELAQVANKRNDLEFPDETVIILNRNPELPLDKLHLDPDAIILYPWGKVFHKATDMPDQEIDVTYYSMTTQCTYKKKFQPNKHTFVILNTEESFLAGDDNPVTGVFACSIATYRSDCTEFDSKTTAAAIESTKKIKSLLVEHKELAPQIKPQTTHPVTGSLIPVRKNYPTHSSYPDLRPDTEGTVWGSVNVDKKKDFTTVLTEIHTQLKSDRISSPSINYLYTLSVDGEFRLLSTLDAKHFEAHHNILASRKNVICAGMIGNTISNDKYQFMISNMSGSYVPQSEAALANAILLMISLGLTETIQPNQIHVSFHTVAKNKYKIFDVSQKYQPWFQHLIAAEAKEMYLAGKADEASNNPNFDPITVMPTRARTAAVNAMKPPTFPSYYQLGLWGTFTLAAAAVVSTLGFGINSYKKH